MENDTMSFTGISQVPSSLYDVLLYPSSCEIPTNQSVSTAVNTVNNEPTTVTSDSPAVVANTAPVLTSNPQTQGRISRDTPSGVSSSWNESPTIVTTNTVQAVEQSNVSAVTTHTVPVLTSNPETQGRASRDTPCGVSSSLNESPTIVTTNTVQAVKQNSVSAVAANTVPVLTSNPQAQGRTSRDTFRGVSSSLNESPTIVTANTIQAVQQNSASAVKTNCKTVSGLTTEEIVETVSKESSVLKRSMEQNVSSIATSTIPNGRTVGASTMVTNVPPCLTNGKSPEIMSNETVSLTANIEQDTGTFPVNTVSSTITSGLSNCMTKITTLVSSISDEPGEGLSTTGSSIVSLVTTSNTKPLWSDYTSTMRVPRMRFHPYSHHKTTATNRHSLDHAGRPCPIHGNIKNEVTDVTELTEKNPFNEASQVPTFRQVEQEQSTSQPFGTNSIKLMQKQLSETISVGNIREKYARLLFGNQHLWSNLMNQPNTRSMLQLQKKNMPILPCASSPFGSRVSYARPDGICVRPITDSVTKQPQQNISLRSHGNMYHGRSFPGYNHKYRNEQKLNPKTKTSQLPLKFPHPPKDSSLVSGSQPEISFPSQQFSRSHPEVLELESPLGIESDASMLTTAGRPVFITQNPFEVFQNPPPMQVQESDSQSREPSKTGHNYSEHPSSSAARYIQESPCVTLPEEESRLYSHIQAERVIGNTALQNSFHGHVPQSPNQRAQQSANTQVEEYPRPFHSQMPVGTFPPSYNQYQMAQPHPEHAAAVPVVVAPNMSVPPRYGVASQPGTFGYGFHPVGHHDGTNPLHRSQLLPSVHPYQPVTYVSRPVLSHQPFLAQEVHVEPGSGTEFQGQRVLNMLGPSLQPTVTTYPNPYMTLRAANALFNAPKMYHKEQENSQQKSDASDQQLVQEQPALERKIEDDRNVPNEEDVDVENPSSSESTSPEVQKWTRRKVYTKNYVKKREKMQKKNEDKLHECSICGKCYSRAFTLKTHYRVHTGEKPYKCRFCTRQFTQSGGLDSHLRTHTGEKPYQCGVCQREFSHSAAVKNHLRTHTGAKPFVCDLGCGKSFADSSTLTKHRRVHTGEKPFECKKCGTKFTQAGNMNKHLKKVHGIERSNKTKAYQSYSNFFSC